MFDRLAALVVEESRWFTASMTVALVGVVALLWRLRGSPIAPRRRILAAMNLFFGLTIGTMAFGHLLAVTTKLVLGTLRGPVPLLYLIGVLLLAPSIGLVAHVVGHGLRGLHAGSTLVCDGGNDLLALGHRPCREVRAGSRRHSPRPQHVERALQLRGEVLLQQFAEPLRRALDRGASLPVHRVPTAPRPSCRRRSGAHTLPACRQEPN